MGYNKSMEKLNDKQKETLKELANEFKPFAHKSEYGKFDINSLIKSYFFNLERRNISFSEFISFQKKRLEKLKNK